MPIRIQDELPAAKTLHDENIFVMTEHRAAHQDIRPLKIILLNLMPTKVATETQILRLLSNSPLQQVSPAGGYRFHESFLSPLQEHQRGPSGEVL